MHQLEQDGHSAIAPIAGLDFSYLGFNMRDPILPDKRVRHAIGYAIDRDAIIKYLRRGLARPAVRTVAADRRGHSSPMSSASRYDPDAREAAAR